MNIRFYHFIVSFIFFGNVLGIAQKSAIDHVPDGYYVYEQILGDLNNDGLDDCILFIKGTDEKNIVTNRFDTFVDRNRRGIVVLFYKNNMYELAARNYDCFESENEDGGVYFPPELTIYIKDSKLFVDYTHGRYGYWHYTFRYSKSDSDFELIGFDSTSTFGPITQTITSINFLTKKRLTRENILQHEEGNDEEFVDTWKNIIIDKPIKLSEIKDFSELSLYDY